ncbi:MAG: anti-sigma factor domain-containing protein [Acidimicrobiales bacterium]
MIPHAEAEQLLGALALDAVDPDERESLELHLETCPKCRNELRNHVEVVGLLAYAGQSAPEGLWDRIASGLSDDPPASGSSVAGRSDPGPDRPGSQVSAFRGVSRVDGAPSKIPATRPGSSRRARWMRLGSLAAAAGIVAVLGVEVAHLQGRVNNLSGQLAAVGDQPNMAQVDRALAVPGARKVVLDSSSGRPELDAVILPGGQGYLYSINLSPLPSTDTYQLWGVVGTQTISYGLVGATPPAVVPFRAEGDLAALAVTAEVSGGVVQSTHKPLAVGRLN